MFYTFQKKSFWTIRISPEFLIVINIYNLRFSNLNIKDSNESSTERCLILEVQGNEFTEFHLKIIYGEIISP